MASVPCIGTQVMHPEAFLLSRGVHLARAQGIPLQTDVLYLMSYDPQNATIWNSDTFTHIVVIARKFGRMGVSTCTCTAFPLIGKGLFKALF